MWSEEIPKEKAMIRKILILLLILILKEFQFSKMTMKKSIYW